MEPNSPAEAHYDQTVRQIGPHATNYLRDYWKFLWGLNFEHDTTTASPATVYAMYTAIRFPQGGISDSISPLTKLKKEQLTASQAVALITVFSGLSLHAVTVTLEKVLKRENQKLSQQDRERNIGEIQQIAEDFYPDRPFGTEREQRNKNPERRTKPMITRGQKEFLDAAAKAGKLNGRRARIAATFGISATTLTEYLKRDSSEFPESEPGRRPKPRRKFLDVKSNTRRYHR